MVNTIIYISIDWIIFPIYLKVVANISIYYIYITLKLYFVKFIKKIKNFVNYADIELCYYFIYKLLYLFYKQDGLL